MWFENDGWAIFPLPLLDPSSPLRSNTAAGFQGVDIHCWNKNMSVSIHKYNGFILVYLHCLLVNRSRCSHPAYLNVVSYSVKTCLQQKRARFGRIPISVVSMLAFDLIWSLGLGWEASSCNFADNLSVLASTAGPKTVERSFALLRFCTLARTLFAIFDIHKAMSWEEKGGFRGVI